MLQGFSFKYQDYPKEYKGDIHEIVYNAPSEPHDGTARNAFSEADLHVSHPQLVPDQATNLHEIPIATELLCRCNGIPIWYPGTMMVGHVCHNTEPQPQHPWNTAAAYHPQVPFVVAPNLEPNRQQYQPYQPAGHGEYGPPPPNREAARRRFGEQRVRSDAADHGQEVGRRGRPVKRASPEGKPWKKASFRGKKGGKRY